jgi:hypothetical protein
MTVVTSPSSSLPGLTRQSTATHATERAVAPDGRIKSGHDGVEADTVYLTLL